MATLTQHSWGTGPVGWWGNNIDNNDNNENNVPYGNPPYSRRGMEIGTISASMKRWGTDLCGLRA